MTRSPITWSGLIAALIGEFAPDAVVIACNTASTLVLPPLRARFSLPFVGTVPAIKPAAERTRSGVVSVLGTCGTIRRDYTRGLIDSFARSCHVRLVGSANLAAFAEAHMRGEAVDDAAILAEIAPAFVEQDGRRTDTIVLACTHYPFLLDHFRRLAPWPVEWIDPAPAIATARGRGRRGRRCRRPRCRRPRDPYLGQALAADAGTAARPRRPCRGGRGGDHIVLSCGPLPLPAADLPGVHQRC